MIDTLTSLRFIFAIMVFSAHCYVIDSFFNTLFFKEGFVGVSFFFVLSGFIIAYNYQKKLSESKISKRTFWVARIARVYPLHWLTLLVAAVLGNYVVASGLAQALFCFAYSNKRLHTSSRLFLLLQQPFLESMLRAAFLLLFPFFYTANQELQTSVLHFYSCSHPGRDRYVFYSGKRHQRILVRESDYPASGLHRRYAFIPAI